MSAPPKLVGVIHLPALPGSPKSAHSMAALRDLVRADARCLRDAGYDAIVVENFGDIPFFAGAVPPITVAAMTVCAHVVRDEAKDTFLCINVLRNDAAAALSIAAATAAQAVRINVHTGARVTDQGIVVGQAAETLRLRAALGCTDVRIWADVAVKHSAPLGDRPLEQEVEDTVLRAMANAVLVTGDGTGKKTDPAKLARVRACAKGAPVLVASGATLESLPELAKVCDGVIVGSALRPGGLAGGPIDAGLAEGFARAFRKAF